MGRQISTADRDRLVAALARAAIAPDEWPRTLRLISTTFGGCFATLLWQHQRDDRGGIALSTVDPQTAEEYNARFAGIDPWAHGARVRGLLRPTRLSDGREYVDTGEFRRSAFFNEFGRDHDLCWFLGGALLSDHDLVAVISLIHGDTPGPFTATETALLNDVFPQIGHAIKLSHRLASQALLDQTAMNLSDNLSMGLILTDTRGRVMFMNRRARALVRPPYPLLSISRTEIRSRQSRETLLLHRAITRACGISGAPETSAIEIREGGRIALEVLVVPTAPAENQAVRASCALVITDLRQSSVTPPVAFQQLFELTPREAEVAALIASGMSLKAVADSLRITVQTARWHLRQIFSKTETSRQQDLVALLLRVTTLSMDNGNAS